jgi:hypothetical protein
MNISELQKQVIESIKNNDIKAALDCLDKHLDNQANLATTLALLISDHRNFVTAQLQNRLSFEQENQSRAGLNAKILTLSEMLSEADLKQDNPILCICKQEEDKQEMIAYFRRMDLPNANVITEEEDFDAAKYEIIIFNNGNVPSEKQEELMKFCIKNTEKTMIHFGENYQNLDRKRFNAANSKFTLFGSIKAVLEYMENDRLYN